MYVEGKKGFFSHREGVIIQRETLMNAPPISTSSNLERDPFMIHFSEA